MKIQGIRVEVYEDLGVHLNRVVVDAQLQPVELGHGIWSGGRSIRVETEGPADRAHVETALKAALDALERK